MRRSPPGRSCLMGLNLRKRPLADLAPEDEEQEAPPPPPAVVVVVDMALAVEGTPSWAHATGSIDNSDSVCKR